MPMTSLELRTSIRMKLVRHPRLFAAARRSRRLLQRARFQAGARGRSRLVDSPVFVICPVRSGSTLLRVLLNSHPDICAPHELHLRFLRVQFDKPYAETAMNEAGLDHDELEHLLWDRLLHRALTSSGKRVIVDKTPGNATYFQRLRTCWPNARFIILLRTVVASLMESRPDRKLQPTIREALAYLNGVEAARTALPGLVVRYEDLADDPAAVTKQVCTYLGIRWRASMLDYGANNHGRFRGGIGDWSSKIKSGQVQPARPLPEPDEIPEQITPIARAWGYLSEPSSDIHPDQGRPGQDVCR
jgi:hypothetical protein